jgi:DNA-binding transcriptional LysR family regulator
MCIISVVSSDASGRRPTRQSQPTIEQARAFCAVAQAGSYRRAAERLGAGEPYIWLIRLVQRFEAALRRPALLDTSVRGVVSLTASGREVLPAAERFVAAAEALIEASTAIRFSAYPSIAGRVVARNADLLDGPMPLLLCDVSEGSRQDAGTGLVHDVETGTLDLAIAPGGMATGSVTEIPLYRWRLRVLLPSGAEPHAGATIAPRQLANFSLAASPRRHSSREHLEHAFASDGVPLTIAIESSSQEMLRDLAQSSTRHAAILPDDAFGPPDRSLGPALVTEDHREWGGSYALYVRHTGSTADDRAEAIAHVVETVRQSLAPAPGE